MKSRTTYTTLAMILVPMIAWAQSMTIRGTVVDDESNEALDYVVVQASVGDVSKTTISRERGKYVITGMPKGKVHIKASYIGYMTYERYTEGEESVEIRMKQSDNEIGEVVVTAHESHGLVSASKIGREQMEHTQPTSLADLMAMLPGGTSKDPNMGEASTIKIRETGMLDYKGNQTQSDKYMTGSLGTLFVVDGAPINTDADMQTISETDKMEKKVSTNRGVDMRSISTDDIESIEVVKGIPSAEYGNLTSGMINIKRTRRTTPLSIRLKADQYGKLASVGSSIELGGHTANVNISALDSKKDPRNKHENYKRINASGRVTIKGDKIEAGPSVDYTGSFDNDKSDPEANNGLTDKYKSRYNRVSATLPIKLNVEEAFVRSIEAIVSASYQYDKLTRQLDVILDRATIAPTSQKTGVQEGKYLPNRYLSEYTCEGKPLNIYGKAKAEGEKNTDRATLGAMAGVEWTLSKNLGEGAKYDVTRPLTATWSNRPRAYKDIPALSVLSAFVEGNATLTLGESKAETQIGVREIGLTGLDARYFLSGKVYLDPRINMQWTLPTIRKVTLSVAGGWGKTTKLPTISYLYPEPWYNNLVQINYYNAKDVEKSLVSVKTFEEDVTNYGLHAARNTKWEIRTDIAWRGHRLSATYYDEEMTSGYRMTSTVNRYTYNIYDLSDVDRENPTLEGLPARETTVLGECKTYPSNGTYTKKQGIEFQYISERIRPLHTSLAINGAWMKSHYTCSEPTYISVDDVVSNIKIKSMYIGLYDADEDKKCETLNTNIMLDTQVPEIGLVFSTTVECHWYKKISVLGKKATPESYMSAEDGELHKWTEECAQDPYLHSLLRRETGMTGYSIKIPNAIYVNMKATKSIGSQMRLAIFANKMLDSTPAYKQNGNTIRRHADPYFGMEVNMNIKNKKR